MGEKAMGRKTDGASLVERAPAAPFRPFAGAPFRAPIRPFAIRPGREKKDAAAGHLRHI
jgi:hypothetical protein